MSTSLRSNGSALTDDQIIASILVHEGCEYTNDPADAGGPTRWGITLGDLQEWHRGQVITAADVKALTVVEAEAIYRMKYLRPFDRLTGVLRVNVIDMGVNAGIQRATKILQELLGVAVDGWVGNETIRGLTKFDADTLNMMYVAGRLLFYEDLIVRKPINAKWRGGWRARALSYLVPITAKIPTPPANAALLMARAD
jgi:lysozyme family protein